MHKKNRFSEILNDRSGAYWEMEIQHKEIVQVVAAASGLTQRAMTFANETADEHEIIATCKNTYVLSACCVLPED